MKTKELLKMLRQGVKPVIRFTENIIDIDPADPGMLGRVIGHKPVEIYDRGEECIAFIIDFSEFDAHNRSVAQPGWYDEKGGPTLIWQNSKYYPKDHKENIWEMLKEKHKDSELKLFEIVELSTHFSEFCAQDKIKDYVTFLENKLDQCISTPKS